MALRELDVEPQGTVPRKRAQEALRSDLLGEVPLRVLKTGGPHLHAKVVV
jgi:hypothetical protein